jgi:hypothetical protein
LTEHLQKVIHPVLPRVVFRLSHPPQTNRRILLQCTPACAQKTRHSLTEIAKVRKVTKSGYRRAGDRLSRCQILPQLDRVQALRESITAMRKYAHIKPGQHLWNLRIRNRSAYFDVGTSLQPLVLKRAQEIWTAEDNLASGPHIGEREDQRRIDAIPVQRAEVSKNRSDWRGRNV